MSTVLRSSVDEAHFPVHTQDAPLVAAFATRCMTVVNKLACVETTAQLAVPVLLYSLTSQH